MEDGFQEYSRYVLFNCGQGLEDQFEFTAQPASRLTLDVDRTAGPITLTIRETLI